MATIGLDKLYYAKITEGENGEETYEAPVQLAKAMSADLSVELAEATLYADDGASEVVKEFKSGTLSLGIDDIGAEVASDLTGATIDQNKVLVSASEDGGSPVAVGFRAKKSNGKYRYFWLYRVIFGIPATNLATKGDSITFSTPTIEGTVLRRNKPDANGKHPWKVQRERKRLSRAGTMPCTSLRTRANDREAHKWRMKEVPSLQSAGTTTSCCSRPKRQRKSPGVTVVWKTWVTSS